MKQQAEVLVLLPGGAGRDALAEHLDLEVRRYVIERDNARTRVLFIVVAGVTLGGVGAGIFAVLASVALIVNEDAVPGWTRSAVWVVLVCACVFLAAQQFAGRRLEGEASRLQTSHESS